MIKDEDSGPQDDINDFMLRRRRGRRMRIQDLRMKRFQQEDI